MAWTRFEGPEFLLGVPRAVRVDRPQVAVDELDGLVQAARGLGLPDLAEAAAAEPLDEAVAGDGLGVGVDAQGHDAIPGAPVGQTLPARSQTLQT